MCVCVCVGGNKLSCPRGGSGAPRRPLLRLASALPPRRSSAASPSPRPPTPVLVPLPLLFLLVDPRRDVAVTPLVPRGPVSQRLAVLPDVPWVNERHHIFVPALRPTALVQRPGPGGQEAVGRGAPDGQADGDGGPVVSVLLHLAVVDAAVRQLGLTN